MDSAGLSRIFCKLAAITTKSLPSTKPFQIRKKIFIDVIMYINYKNYQLQLIRKQCHPLYHDRWKTQNGYRSVLSISLLRWRSAEAKTPPALIAHQEHISSSRQGKNKSSFLFRFQSEFISITNVITFKVNYFLNRCIILRSKIESWN